MNAAKHVIYIDRSEGHTSKIVNNTEVTSDRITPLQPDKDKRVHTRSTGVLHLQ